MEEEPKANEEQEEESPKPAAKNRERSVSPVRQLREVSKAPGSIGKLKISSEMRAKLELVTISHNTKSSTSPKDASNNGRVEPVGIRKLEDNRRLMLQQQLGGRKWDTVEEIERITRRASSEDRSDLIKAVHNRTPVNRIIITNLIINIYELMYVD